MLDQNKSSQKTKYRPEYPKNFTFDYKDPVTLSFFISDGGRILPSRITRLSLIQQRRLKACIKRARVLSLLPMGFSAYNRFGKAEQISAKKFDLDVSYPDHFNETDEREKKASKGLSQSVRKHNEGYFSDRMESSRKGEGDFPEKFLQQNAPIFSDDFDAGSMESRFENQTAKKGSKSSSYSLEPEPLQEKEGMKLGPLEKNGIQKAELSDELKVQQKDQESLESDLRNRGIGKGPSSSAKVQSSSEDS